MGLEPGGEGDPKTEGRWNAGVRHCAGQPRCHGNSGGLRRRAPRGAVMVAMATGAFP